MRSGECKGASLSRLSVARESKIRLPKNPFAIGADAL
jgi:hypothetical protein